MKISRRAANGSLSSAHFMPWNFSRSASVKSSSFFMRKSRGPSNVRLLSTVSMWNTFRWLSTTAPWRFIEWLIAESGGFMYEFESAIILGVWWAFRLS
jgi:hypothetical protein